ncbi:helix-turn-helix domain-containing protein [uncultured Muribaculum sp.]|nr:helix-turn-helix domain-containing protein [uncultured Muribaculum sp.]
MTSEFIATLQRVENVSHLLSKMGESTVDEAVQRIESIYTFMERYGDLGEIFEHFKELESKLFMCREMLTVEEAAEYIGVSKSQIYLMTSNKEITHFKPRGKFIYIERKELDDVLRRNVI